MPVSFMSLYSLVYLLGVVGGIDRGPEKSAEPMLSFPSSAGSATRAEATVAYISNGYVRGGCKTVKSSGDEAADEHACQTVSFYKTNEPVYSVTSVWISPKFEGRFSPPILKNTKKVIAAQLYPSGALARGDQGTTTVKLVVNLEGRISTCEVAQSSGYKSIDRVTCKSLSKAKYHPASLEGFPTEAVVYLSVGWGAGSRPPPTKLIKAVQAYSLLR